MNVIFKRLRQIKREREREREGDGLKKENK